MMSQDNRLLPLTHGNLDRPLADLTQSKKDYGVSASDPTHLRDYLAVVLKRKWLILSLVVVTAGTEVTNFVRHLPGYAARAQDLQPQVLALLSPLGVTEAQLARPRRARSRPWRAWARPPPTTPSPS